MASTIYRFRCAHSAVFKTIVRSLSTKSPQTSKHVLDEMFSADETERVLECFNKCTPEELHFTKQLGLQKAHAMVQYREKNGHFGMLSELLRVQGVGILGMQKLCTAMKNLDYTAVCKLREKMHVETMKTSPPLPEDLQQNLSSIVALELHADSVSFAQMSRDLSLEAWGSVPLLDKKIQRVDPIEFLKKLLHVVDCLPKADIYVLESKIYRYSSLRVVPHLTTIRVLEAMLVTLLNSDLSTSEQHKVFFLKPNSVMHFFKLAVGGDRVSGQHILRELERGVTGGSESYSLMADVDISDSLWRQFHSEISVGREHLTNCVLLSVAFYKQMILNS